MANNILSTLVKKHWGKLAVGGVIYGQSQAPGTASHELSDSVIQGGKTLVAEVAPVVVKGTTSAISEVTGAGSASSEANPGGQSVAGGGTGGGGVGGGETQDSGMLSGAMNYIKENPIMSMLIGAALWFGGKFASPILSKIPMLKGLAGMGPFAARGIGAAMMAGGALCAFSGKDALDSAVSSIGGAAGSVLDTFTGGGDKSTAQVNPAPAANTGIAAATPAPETAVAQTPAAAPVPKDVAAEAAALAKKSAGLSIADSGSSKPQAPAGTIKDASRSEPEIASVR